MTEITALKKKISGAKKIKEIAAILSTGFMRYYSIAFSTLRELLSVNNHTDESQMEIETGSKNDRF